MDPSNVLVWNVRGLNDRGRRDNVHKVVDSCRPNIICLQETKLAHISERDVLGFLGRDYRKFVYPPAQGTRGGILGAWREDVFMVDHWKVH